MKKFLLTLGLMSALTISVSAANRTDTYLTTSLNSELSGTASVISYCPDTTVYVCTYKDGLLTDVQIPQINLDRTFTAVPETLDDADKVAVYLWQSGTMVPLSNNVYDLTAIDKGIAEDSMFTSYMHETVFVTDIGYPEGSDALMRINGIDHRGIEVSYDITSATGIWGIDGDYMYNNRNYNASLLNDPADPSAPSPDELINKGDVLLIDSVGSRASTILIAASPYKMDTEAADFLGWADYTYHSYSSSTRDGWMYGAVTDCYIEDDEAVFSIGDTVWSDDKDRPIPMAEIEFGDDGTLLNCSLGTVRYSELDPPKDSEDRSYDMMVLYTYRNIVQSAAVYRLTNAPANYTIPAKNIPGDYGSYGLIINAESNENGISVDMFDVESNAIKTLTMAAGTQLWPSTEDSFRPAEASDLSAICDRTIFADYYRELPLTLCRYRDDDTGAITSLCLAGMEDSSAAVKFSYDSYAAMTSSAILSSRYFIGNGITEVWAADDMNSTYAQQPEYYSAAEAAPEDYLVLNQNTAACFVDFDSTTKKPSLILRFSSDKSAPNTSIEEDGWTAEGHPAIMVTEVGEDYVTGIENGANVTYETISTTSLYEIQSSVFANRQYDAAMVWHQGSEGALSDYISAGDIVIVDTSGTQINTMLKMADSGYVTENGGPVWPNGVKHIYSEARDSWIGGTVSSVQEINGQASIQIGEENVFISPEEPVAVLSGATIDAESSADIIEEGDIVIVKMFRSLVQNVFVYRIHS